MDSKLIKRIVNVDEIPRISKKKTSVVRQMLVEAIQELQPGQAAELNQNECKAQTMRWHLNRLKKEGLYKDVKIAFRGNGKKSKKAFLIKEKNQA